ncbi:MAG TPA: cytochrome c biogenesis protein CcdA [Candidatus Acidoferrales bacterium]|jgi:cytochrome c-type biogenesis protein|nr:cytochrome c biogenesis protein CcdA [Candidatus Acidoferrales bacterium]
MQVSILYAFIAGIISFLSPCVLPLVPGYVSMLSGIGVEQLRTGQPARNSLFASSLAFVSGFSVVFISFGASASAVGQFLLQHKTLMGPVAGAVIVLFGLHLVGWLIKLPVNAGLVIGGVLAFGAAILWRRAGTETLGPGGLFGSVQLLSVAIIFLAGPSLTRWLNRDVRFHNLGSQTAEEAKSGGALSGVTSGFLLGFAFAFGWTPCIGPILAAVLVLAANTQTISRGVFLLAIYSAGLAVPFLLTAIGINQFLRFYQRFRRHLHTVEVLSGVLLLFVGGLIFLNRLTWLSGKLGFLNKFAL